MLSSQSVRPIPIIAIHVPGPLRDYCAGKARLEVAGGTVLDVLRHLEQTQPALYRNICDETGRIRQHLNVFVNSDHIRDRDGTATLLAAGDVVTFLPAVSGGSICPIESF
jgi:molybdopterin synthase sulfur carrier subunit